MTNDNVNTETEVTQTHPAAEPQGGEPSGGTQPASATPSSTPAQDKQPGSETPMIPKPRLDEALVRMHRAEAELARLRQGQQPQSAPQPPQAPKPEDFSTYEEFVRADARYVAQQEFQRLKQEEQQQAQVKQFQDRAAKAQANYMKKLGEAVAKDPTVQAILDSAPTLRPDLSINLMEYPNPVDLGKHLAMNPELVYEMNSLPPDLAVQRMWMIGQTLAGSKTQPQSASKAPPPISPVGAGKTNTAVGYRDDMSQEEFNRAFPPMW